MIGANVFNMRNKSRLLPLYLLFLCIFLVACQSAPEEIQDENNPAQFNQLRSFQDIEYQVSLGPRTIGSPAHDTVVDWINSVLDKNEWQVELQMAEWAGNNITNVVGKRGEGSPWIILGAHFDSRFVADRDTDLEKRKTPVTGANDGASGVAVLLELARVIPTDINKQIWLVFFDAEDNGNIPGWEWSIGSGIFVNRLEMKPDAVVVVDMIGDEELTIYKEKNSEPDLTEQLWKVASDLGYHQFIPEYKHRIIDDHVPFLQQNIPASLIIDFDYPYWHTSQDLVEKVSAESLSVVGNTILSWLMQKP